MLRQPSAGMSGVTASAAPQPSTEISTAMTVDLTREGVAPGVIKVVLDAPLRAPFDYLPPPGLPAETVPIGARVRVPLGRRETVGWVVGHAEQSTLAAEALKSERVKYATRTTSRYNHDLSDDEALDNFVARIEDIAMTEVTEWRGEFARTTDGSPGDQGKPRVPTAS